MTGFFSSVVRDSRRRAFASPSPLGGGEVGEPMAVEPGVEAVLEGAETRSIAASPANRNHLGGARAFRAEASGSAAAPVEFPAEVSAPGAPAAARIRRKPSTVQSEAPARGAADAGSVRPPAPAFSVRNPAFPAGSREMVVARGQVAENSSEPPRAGESAGSPARPALPHRAKEMSPGGRFAPQEPRLGSPVREHRASREDGPIEPLPESGVELPHVPLSAPEGAHSYGSEAPPAPRPAVPDAPRAAAAEAGPELRLEGPAPAAAPAAAEEPAAADWQRVRTLSRVLPSASDLAGSAVALPVAAAEPAGPSVQIGVVEIVVAAPVEKRAPAAAPSTPSNLASRRYLRSL